MKKSQLQEAREYRDSLTLWFIASRDYDYHLEPAPEPPASLKGPQAARIYDEIERDVNREWRDK